MHEADRKFTVEDLRAVSNMLGTPLPPRVIAEDADSIARNTNTRPNTDSTPSIQDSLEVVHEKMFLLSFFNNFTNTPTNYSEPQNETDRFLNTFERWRHGEIERFGISEDSSSQNAYRILLRLSVTDTVRFAEQQRRLYATKHKSNGYSMSEYEYFRQREETWNALQTTASHAQVLAGKRKKPKM